MSDSIEQYYETELERIADAEDEGQIDSDFAEILEERLLAQVNGWLEEDAAAEYEPTYPAPYNERGGYDEEAEEEERLTDLLQRMQEGAGREFTSGEIERLVAEDEAAQLRGDEQIQLESIVHNTDTPKGRAALINDRIRDVNHVDTPDTIAPLAENASKAERVAYMDARASGAEIEE